MNERFEGQGKGKQEFRAGDYILEADFTPPTPPEDTGDVKNSEQPLKNEMEAVFDTLPADAQEAISGLSDAPTDGEVASVLNALPEEAQEAIQNLPADPEKVIDLEQSFSERFSGIAQRGARVFAFITALFAVPGIVQAAGLTEYEQAKAARQAEYKARTGVDLAQRGVLQEGQRRQLEAQKFENAVNQETLKEQRVTPSGSWGEQFVIKAESDMGRVKDAQDAEWLARTHIDGFVREYHQPSRGGNMERFDAHRIHRVYTSGDLEKLMTDALHLKGILDTLNTRYGIQGYETHLSNLNTVIRDLEIRGKYSNQMEEKAYQEYNREHRHTYGGHTHSRGQRYIIKFH